MSRYFDKKRQSEQKAIGLALEQSSSASKAVKENRRRYDRFKSMDFTPANLERHQQKEIQFRKLRDNLRRQKPLLEMIAATQKKPQLKIPQSVGWSSLKKIAYFEKETRDISDIIGLEYQTQGLNLPYRGKEGPGGGGDVLTRHQLA